MLVDIYLEFCAYKTSIVARSSVSPCSLNLPIQHGRFTPRKLSDEDVFVNYIVSRGHWMEAPPTCLDFDSCKNGPIIYVNEVAEKKVSQIWEWDVKLGRWTSIREGDTFHTERERELVLDKNQVPRLWAVRKRRVKSVGNDG